MAIELLKRELDRKLHDLEQRPRSIGSAHLMQKISDSLRGSGHGGRSSVSRMEEGLRLLLGGELEEALPYLRHLCWALNHPVNGTVLLREIEPFHSLMFAVEELQAEGNLDLNPWRGLLDGYLAADDQTLIGAGLENWSELRSFLRNTLPYALAKARPRLEWPRVLSDHSNLLTDRPCDRYGVMMLSGEAGVLDRLRDDLRIPQESWFWRETVLARVRAACDVPKGRFAELLSELLQMVEKYPLLINEALKLLLTRYYTEDPSTPHEDLRDFATAHWGTPNIFAQSQKWAQVDPAIKEMVLSWIVRADLQDFFEVLQEDRTADRRRFAFWLRYHRQISYVRIALGADAYHSTHPDFVDLRRNKKERICKYTAPQSKINAIIMKIGAYFFVEFSHTGNAAYGYGETQFPANASAGHMHESDLKWRARATFWQSHNGTWEEKFADRLADLGVFPDEGASAKKSPIRRQPPPRPIQMLRAGLNEKIEQRDRVPSNAPVMEIGESERSPITQVQLNMVRRMCLAARIPIEDKRDKGGAVWVYLLSENGSTAEGLRLAGFRYAPGKGYWRK
jgi:hypothetical protein